MVLLGLKSEDGRTWTAPALEDAKVAFSDDPPALEVASRGFRVKIARAGDRDPAARAGSIPEGYQVSRVDRAEMERLFYAWPETRMPDGSVLPFTAQSCRSIIAAWKKPGMMPAAKVAYTRFFSANYARIQDLSGDR